MGCFNEKSDLFHLAEGRYFSEKEIEEGRKTIILDYFSYRSNYSENTIGDIITYGGIEFKLIGIHNTINDSRTLLPYNTFAKNPGSMEKAGIRIGDVELEFPERLSRHMLNKMKEQFYEETGSPIILKTLYSQVTDDIIPYVILYTIIIIFLLILFFTCIRQLYSIIDGMNRHKYDVLLRVGMDEGMWQLTRFIGMEVCMFVSYIISIIFFYGTSNIISKTGFQASLPIWNTILFFALFQGILLLRIPIQRIQRKRGGKGQNEKNFTVS